MTLATSTKTTVHTHTLSSYPQQPPYVVILMARESKSKTKFNKRLRLTRLVALELFATYQDECKSGGHPPRKASHLIL